MNSAIRVGKVLLLTVLVASTGFSAEPKVLTDAERFSFVMNREEQQSLVRELNPAKRRQLLSEVSASARTSSDPQTWDGARLLLGDEEMIAKYTEMFVKGADGEAASANVAMIGIWKHEPSLIRRLAPALFYPDELFRPGQRYVRSPSAAHIVLDTLREAPGLPKEVSEWAKQVQTGNSYFAVFSVREWYAANEEVLKRGRYEALRPGTVPPPEDAYRMISGKDGLKFEMLVPFNKWTAPVPGRVWMLGASEPVGGQIQQGRQK